MADDITYRLRHAAWTAEEGSDVEHLNIAAAEIERLRAERDEWQAGYHKAWSELGLAADEIERLRAEVARLGAFLHPIGEKARRG